MADNLTTFMCQIVLKSGILNLLEPSGPPQVCNGIALPLLYHTQHYSNMQLYKPHYAISRLAAQEVGCAASDQFHHYVLINESIDQSINV
jgi:hypothetical protein